ncbi:hypothetical protein BGZ65_005406 [Modicella reniformis]|uniref:CAF1B/HIR1 beta-propeller domain-containing protein n=1 Tax=Modicella reniformis TaxID=1440133 RepID=A0A9P6ST53_9FUNG|nr:hypothetical protein BGZ65_005406 [Modicella reniformis]
MKVKPLQIHWHDKQPIYSAHFEPGPKGRLATAGGDGNVRIWRIVKDKDSTHVEFLSSLNRHTAAVNVVRFSPTDGSIILWRPSETKDAPNKFAESDDDEYERETWRVQSMMRGSLSDIYDLAWSPDGRYIISGSIDNTARIWDVRDAKCIHVIADHHHYVQGVAWDPLGEFVATQSSDRSVHVYAFKVDKNGHVSAISLGKNTKLDLTKLRSIPQPPTPAANTTGTRNLVSATEASADASAEKDEASKPAKATAKSFRLYHDETLTSFFRRLSFTPDGSMLLTPAGQYKAPVHKHNSHKEDDPGSAYQAPELETRNTVYVYARRDFSKGPIAHLPGHKKPSVAIKCSPVLYELRHQLKPPSPSSDYSQRATNRLDHESGAQATPITMAKEKKETPQPPSVFGLSYRSVYAVATQDSVLIYDTQQTTALALVSHLHYATFTDMTWSSDGCNLILTSSDGFCSIISFEEGELGIVYTPPKSMMALLSTCDKATTVQNDSTDSSASIAATAGMLQKLNGLTLAEQKEQKEQKDPKDQQKAKPKQEKSLGSDGKKTTGKQAKSRFAATPQPPTTTFQPRISSKNERDGDAIMASANEEPSQKKRKTLILDSTTSVTAPSVSVSVSVSASTSTTTTALTSSTPTTLDHGSLPPGSDGSSSSSNATEERPKKKRITPIFVSALPGH